MSAMRKKMPAVADPDETRNIFELIEEVLPGSRWLDIPNAHLATKTPLQAIKDGKEKSVRDIILTAKYGMFS